MNLELIGQYVGGADVPAQAIAGLSQEEMNLVPADGSWSLREIVIHLMDSDLVGADHLKRIIAMDNPVLFAFDQDAFSKRLNYSQIDLSDACEIFSLNRKTMHSTLESLSEDDFLRTGKHSAEGMVTLEGLIEAQIRHLEHHVEFILKKRELVGNALAI